MNTNELLKRLRELRSTFKDESYELMMKNVGLCDESYSNALRKLNHLIRELEMSLGYQPIRFDD